jgi:hypothetical protein
MTTNERRLAQLHDLLLSALEVVMALFIFGMLLLALTSFAGCTSLPMDLTKMSPEQMKAMKEASVTVQCTTGTGPWGKVQTTMTSVDRNSVSPGTTSIENECGKSTVTVEPKPLLQPTRTTP